MTRYERLLVPVDGSDASHTAARHALSLAAATGAAVDVLHVLEAGQGGDAFGGAEHRTILEERGRRILDAVESLAADAGVDVTLELRSGRPHEVILDYATERGTDLVAMGRHGAGTVGERLLGGVTDRVLRVGTHPVLTAWADGTDDEGVVGAEAILLPTDGSDPAERAGEHAAALAEIAGASVHVVSVADLDAAGGLFDAGGLEEGFVEDLEDRHRAAAERLAGTVESAADVPVETAVRRGRAAAALRDYVEGEGVDAVVMGAQGRSGVRRMLLGSVTARLLRTVEVPMLVVPARE